MVQSILAMGCHTTKRYIVLARAIGSAQWQAHEVQALGLRAARLVLAMQGLLPDEPSAAECRTFLSANGYTVRYAGAGRGYQGARLVRSSEGASPDTLTDAKARELVDELFVNL